MRTLQEIFDRVAEHLLRQNAKAQSADGYCRYRAADGRMRAVGVLIPDELYYEELEGQGVLCIPESIRAAIWDMPKDFLASEAHSRYLRELQRIHDLKPTETWRPELQAFADRYGLDTDVLERSESDVSAPA